MHFGYITDWCIFVVCLYHCDKDICLSYHFFSWSSWVFYCVLNLKFAMELHYNDEMFTLLGFAIAAIFALIFLVIRCIIQKCRISDTSGQTRIQPYNVAPARNQNERRNSINNNSCIHDRRKPEENDERLCVTV